MNRSLHKIGFWSGLCAFTATIGYLIAQILHVLGVIKYPTDAILIVGFSLCNTDKHKAPFTFE